MALVTSSTLIASRAPAHLAETLLAQITALLMKPEPSPLLAPRGKTSVLSREGVSPSLQTKVLMGFSSLQEKVLEGQNKSSLTVLP